MPGKDETNQTVSALWETAMTREEKEVVYEVAAAQSSLVVRMHNPPCLWRKSQYIAAKWEHWNKGNPLPGPAIKRPMERTGE